MTTARASEASATAREIAKRDYTSATERVELLLRSPNETWAVLRALACAAEDEGTPAGDREPIQWVAQRLRLLTEGTSNPAWLRVSRSRFAVSTRAQAKGAAGT